MICWEDIGTRQFRRIRYCCCRSMHGVMGLEYQTDHQTSSKSNNPIHNLHLFNSHISESSVLAKPSQNPTMRPLHRGKCHEPSTVGWDSYKPAFGEWHFFLRALDRLSISPQSIFQFMILWVSSWSSSWGMYGEHWASMAWSWIRRNLSSDWLASKSSSL